MRRKIVIYIEEEYGFREMEYTFFGSKLDLINAWQEGNFPYLSGEPYSVWGNNLRILETCDDVINCRNKADAHAHVFWDDDTHLNIDGILVDGFPSHPCCGSNECFDYPKKITRRFLWQAKLVLYWNRMRWHLLKLDKGNIELVSLGLLVNPSYLRYRWPPEETHPALIYAPPF